MAETLGIFSGKDQNSNFDYKDLNTDKKYDIKTLVLTKMQIDLNFEIKSLDDIAFLQVKFGETFPFNNHDGMEGVYRNDLDYLVDVLIIRAIGSGCANQNILFGLLLIELGIDVQLIKGSGNSRQSFLQNSNFHYSNIVRYNGKVYLVEACLTFLSNYSPVELGNEIGCSPTLIKTKKLYRVIKSNLNDPNDTLYIMQQKNKPSDEYINLLEFESAPIRYGQMMEDFHHFKTIAESAEKTFMMYIKFKDGYYFYINGSFKTTYYNGSETIVKISNNTQLSKIIKKYFNVESLFLKPNISNLK